METKKVKTVEYEIKIGTVVRGRVDVPVEVKNVKDWLIQNLSEEITNTGQTRVSVEYDEID